MLEFVFDLQRFDDGDIGAEPDASAEQSSSEDTQDLPEELGGLPEDIARETLEEWESTQSDAGMQATTQDDAKPGAVPYDRFKEKVDEANQLKAQLAQYQQALAAQQQQQQSPQGQQQPPPQEQPPRQPPLKITLEISKQINKVIEEEALSMTGKNKLTRVYSCAKVIVGNIHNARHNASRNFLVILIVSACMVKHKGAINDES